MEGKVYPGIKNAIILCLLFLAAQLIPGLIIGIVIGVLSALGNPIDLSLALNVSVGVVNIAAFAGVLAIGFKKTKRSFNEVFKLNKVSPFLWAATVIFIIGFVMVSSELDNLLNYILPPPEMFQSVFGGLMSQSFVLGIIIIGIVPGITEELFFRGLILDGLNRNYSKGKAILISALLFGVVHLNPWQFLSAFIIGLILGWICIETHSILLCMFIHFFNNTLYTITVKYRGLIPIQGFNSNFAASGEFQPLWFDITGLVILAVGVMLLLKAIKKQKNGA